ncbi:hypothetical protein K443DRAFT_415035 [Laccaria amethystina LaAM-08-1]|uniref:Unplaced genomic scaffold K443scaffold_339, whole genome shotgun sequence n=1 Tax=Laccaria amethystina LaAM-08-1 TaxID=1095629 RepID=A0A0C9X9H3_9AGAR|nr:hypothetical protein K443DRAFT_415035 [Laccaria amethystina LaAM-08-1]
MIVKNNSNSDKRNHWYRQRLHWKIKITVCKSFPMLRNGGPPSFSLVGRTMSELTVNQRK